MDIQGLQKMTLLDYPGRVACTVFLGGCDLRCPFCHNGGLVLGPMPAGLDSEELLAFLKEEGLPAAVATSTDRRTASRYWDLAEITSFITASVCGNEVTSCKPEPDIFLKAAHALQIAPEHCLIVEDSINGLKAARAAGGISCMVPDLTPYTEELRPFCDYVCGDLSQLLPSVRLFSIRASWKRYGVACATLYRRFMSYTMRSQS